MSVEQLFYMMRLLSMHHTISTQIAPQQTAMRVHSIALFLQGMLQLYMIETSYCTQAKPTDSNP